MANTRLTEAHGTFMPMSSAAGLDNIHGQAPINVRSSIPPALQQPHGCPNPAESAQSTAEPAAELEQAQKQRQRSPGNPAWRRKGRGLTRRRRGRALTTTVSGIADTGAGAALHGDISRHKRHRRAAAGAASGFKATGRGWGPGDFVPKMRRTACRRTHSFSSRQSRQVAAGSQILRQPSQQLQRQPLPARKLNQQQRPQQQQLAQSSPSPMSSSHTSTAQDVQHLSFFTEGSRSLLLLQPAHDNTVRQVQLGPQAIGSSQQAQEQADAAGPSVPPSCPKSFDSSQARAQPEHSVDVQPLTDIGCKKAQAETAGTGQQVDTVHQLKQIRKHKATEDVDPDRVPKKVSIAKRQKASPRQSAPHSPLQSEPLQRRRVLRGSSWQSEDGSSVGEGDVVMAKAPSFKKFWPAKVAKPCADHKEQLDQVYSKLVQSKEVYVPITYFGDGTVAYANLANVQKFAAVISTAGLKKSLVTAMEHAQAAYIASLPCI